MSIDHYQNLLTTIDFWIKAQKTGSPKAFARRLGLSSRHLRNYLEYIRSKGAKIAYSRSRKTYYYEIPGEFHIEIFFQEK